MTIGAIVDPDILLAAESHEGGGTVKECGSLLTERVEDHANSVRISFVAIDEHDGPVSIGTMQRVGGHERIAIRIFYVRVGREHVVHPCAMLHPFKIDHARGEIGRSVALNVVIFIGDEIRPGGPAQAGVMNILGLNRRVIKGCATSFEKRPYVIGQP